MKSVAFCTLGCKVNQYETDAMEEMFLAAGYQVRTFKEKADVYVINTCTVTNIADRKSRQMLHRAKKMNPDSVVAAVGCYVQAAAERVQKGIQTEIRFFPVPIPLVVVQRLEKIQQRKIFPADRTVQKVECLPVAGDHRDEVFRGEVLILEQISADRIGLAL